MGNIQARLSDTELTAQLQEQNALSQKATPLLVIGFVLIGLGIILGFAGITVVCIIMVILGMVPVFIGVSKKGKAQEAIKRLLSENLLPPILDGIFDKWEHEAFGRLGDSIIHNTNMGFDHFNTISGSDHITAVYRGLNLEVSDLHLENVETEWVEVTDEDGNTSMEQRETRTTVFRGQWMVCDFAKPLAAELLVFEDNGRIRKNRVLTENDDSNKKFLIRTEDAHTAFYVLTPHMMEYIMAMDEKADGKTRMRFAKNGKVHIAIDNGRDLFEGQTAKTEEDLAKIRAAYTGELRYFTDLIDELLNNKTLFAAR